jgi:hypothetical protein
MSLLSTGSIISRSKPCQCCYDFLSHPTSLWHFDGLATATGLRCIQGLHLVLPLGDMHLALTSHWHIPSITCQHHLD